MSEVRPSPAYLRIKRVLDVAAALVGLVLLSPLLLLAAVGTRLTSRGPIFFSQERGGRFGRRFVVYKFRTMDAGHVHDPNEVVPLTHPGITPFGRFLRRTKIDELPQLWNVLKGDMSIIGPRPTIPEQIERYNEFERQRLLLRPGITGLAQVNGNTLLPWPERIRYDVYYVRHCSLGLDLRILIRTVAVLLLGDRRFARTIEQSPYAPGEDGT